MFCPLSPCLPSPCALPALPCHPAYPLPVTLPASPCCPTCSPPVILPALPMCPACPPHAALPALLLSLCLSSPCCPACSPHAALPALPLSPCLSSPCHPACLPMLPCMFLKFSSIHELNYFASPHCWLSWWLPSAVSQWFLVPRVASPSHSWRVGWGRVRCHCCLAEGSLRAGLGQGHTADLGLCTGALTPSRATLHMQPHVVPAPSAHSSPFLGSLLIS